MRKVKQCSLLEFFSNTQQNAHGKYVSEKKEVRKITLSEDRLKKELVVEDGPILLSVDYDGEKECAFAKLYDPESGDIILWWDEEKRHRPYCLTDLKKEIVERLPQIVNHKGFLRLEKVEKIDLLRDRVIKMTKIVAKDPLSIGGRPDSIRELLPEDPHIRGVKRAWEAQIHYHHCFIYDNNLIPGFPHRIEGGILRCAKVDISPKLLEDVLKMLEEEEYKEEYYDVLKRYLPLFLHPTPPIRRAAMDIEVYSPQADRIPDPKKAEFPVISVAFATTDGNDVVLVLKRRDKKADLPEDLPEGVKVEFFDDEKDLLKRTFEILDSYPLILTFNGDNFDLQYLYNRALRLGLRRESIPIVSKKDYMNLRRGCHIDLYRFFSNNAIRVYAFDGVYKDITLDAISEALLGKGKISLEIPIADLEIKDLIRYNYRDAKITLELTQFSDNLVMKLIFLLMRISRLPIEDLTRKGVSKWIQSLFYAEHRIHNYLIPRAEELQQLKGVKSTEAIIKGKKYKGAIVVTPVPGVHFNVTVLDFASLYPSVIKTWNLSYETVRCPHESCKDNRIPETNHWVCKKRKGISSIIIGFLRDIRVKWAKPESKNKELPEELRAWYSVLQRALKVFINASYGVFGAEHFPLFCLPVAESTTAIGRYAITETIKMAKEMNLKVIYGDTDSIFIEQPSAESVQKLIEWSKKELGIELDIDKVYRYVALSERKKNYLGVFEDGTVDIKGLAGKKRNTPLFIQNAFMNVVKMLGEVKSPEDFENAKENIRKIIQDCYLKLKRREFELEELAFRVQLTKPLDSYRKVTPQHVKAARMLKAAGKDVKPGDIISFVKVKGPVGVKPVELARKEEIDVDKYLSHIETAFEQILDALGIEFSEILGTRSLDIFM
ncbi:MAG: DNA-directed DNA polymerase I [Candidatus Baldrarchaeia archaeon]